MKIERLPRCRWCGKEPEFADQSGPHEKMCLHCEAIQDPVLCLRNPITGVMIQFFVNPDASLFVEFSKKNGATDRYTLDSGILRKIGVLQSFSEPRDGRK